MNIIIQTGLGYLSYKSGILVCAALVGADFSCRTVRRTVLHENCGALFCSKSSMLRLLVSEVFRGMGREYWGNPYLATVASFDDILVVSCYFCGVP